MNFYVLDRRLSEIHTMMCNYVIFRVSLEAKILFANQDRLFKSKGNVLLHGILPYLADENDLRSVVLKENNLAFSGKKRRWELQSMNSLAKIPPQYPFSHIVDIPI